ncbi:MAG: hypothetical protein KGQ66_18835 [Acidobacteriota bacterium]|nr:hypothetical protein [Acidobacteriota bacterium]
MDEPVIDTTVLRRRLDSLVEGVEPPLTLRDAVSARRRERQRHRTVITASGITMACLLGAAIGLWVTDRSPHPTPVTVGAPTLPSNSANTSHEYRDALISNSTHVAGVTNVKKVYLKLAAVRQVVQLSPWGSGLYTTATAPLGPGEARIVGLNDEVYVVLVEGAIDYDGGPRTNWLYDVYPPRPRAGTSPTFAQAVTETGFDSNGVPSWFTQLKDLSP